MSQIINAKTLGGLQQTMDAGNPNHIKLQCDGTTIVTVTPDGVVFDVGTGGGSGASGPAFSAYQSSAQSVANSTAVKVLFQAETYDTDNCFALSTGTTPNQNRFTAPQAGIYNFSWRVALTVASNTWVETKLYKNGNLALKGIKIAGATGINHSGGSGDVLLQAGDYVEVYTEFTDTAARSTVAGISETYFHGHFVRSI
jgi:hypothetical protein